jgi:hypothetical protein
VTRVARLVAATLAIVLALFPLATERCRTACATPPATAQAAPSAHACHEVAPDERGVVANPLPRTCGHSDQARLADTVALAVSRTRVTVDTSPGLLTAPLSPVAIERFVESPPRASAVPDRVVLPRDLPLRL